MINSPTHYNCVLFKAQLHKQLKESYKFGIDDLLNFINDNTVSTGKEVKLAKEGTSTATTNITVKKKKKNDKNNKNNKQSISRKDSDNLIIEEFLINLKKSSVPKEKIVKIRTNLTKDSLKELNKNYIFCIFLIGLFK